MYNTQRLTCCTGVFPIGLDMLTLPTPPPPSLPSPDVGSLIAAKIFSTQASLFKPRQETVPLPATEKWGLRKFGLDVDAVTWPDGTQPPPWVVVRSGSRVSPRQTGTVDKKKKCVKRHRAEPRIVADGIFVENICSDGILHSAVSKERNIED